MEASGILGVVPAAGRSERMGRSKALLRLGDRSFLRAVVETLTDGGCDDVVVVAGTSDVEAEARSAGARVVWNDAATSEQVDSIRLGLAAAGDDITAAIVLPVDHPLVRPATVRALVEAHDARPDAVVRPVHAGRPGHPTLFPRGVWRALRDPSLDRGARSVVDDPTIETLDIPVDDAGVLADIDTPDAYARVVRTTPDQPPTPDQPRPAEAAATPATPATPATSPTSASERRVGPVEAARAALAARGGGRAVAMVSRADAGGDGERLLVFGPDEVLGSLGDPVLDRAACALGTALLASGEMQARTDAVEDAPGIILYAEAHRPLSRLFVVGAGHIALPLARIGDMLGFGVVVLDDRETFATEARFPDAARVLRVDFADPFADLAPERDDFVVLVTRAHRYDFDCLHRLLDMEAPPRYIGMVGSIRRVRAAYRALLGAGVAAERLATVRAPIGVDIGAETPGEIATAIAAELVAVRRGVTAAGSLRDRERVVERWLGEAEAG